MERRVKDDRSTREAIRMHKRYLAREVYRYLTRSLFPAPWIWLSYRVASMRLGVPDMPVHGPGHQLSKTRDLVRACPHHERPVIALSVHLARSNRQVRALGDTRRRCTMTLRLSAASNPIPTVHGLFCRCDKGGLSRARLEPSAKAGHSKGTRVRSIDNNLRRST